MLYDTLEQISKIIKETEKNIPPNLLQQPANSQEDPHTPSIPDDVIMEGVKESRVRCFVELRKMYDQDYNEMRSEIDDVHLNLQKIRIKSVVLVEEKNQMMIKLFQF